jgi:hypothetical protein
MVAYLAQQRGRGVIIDGAVRNPSNPINVMRRCEFQNQIVESDCKQVWVCTAVASASGVLTLYHEYYVACCFV